MLLSFLFACCIAICSIFPLSDGDAKGRHLFHVNVDTARKYVDLTGTWLWRAETATFDLVIRQKRDSIKGYYCAVASNGRRIDCPDSESDGYCIVMGVLKGNKARIAFSSDFSEEGMMDTATITYNAKTKTLLWIWNQKNIVAYAPHRAILYRSN